MSVRLIGLAMGVYGFPGANGAEPAKMSPPLKAVLTRLAWKAEDDGSDIKISKTALADDTGLNYSTVGRALKELEERELIILLAEEDRARKLPKVWALNVPLLMALPITKTEAVFRERLRHHSRRGGNHRGQSATCGAIATGGRVSESDGRVSESDGTVDSRLLDQRPKRPCGPAGPSLEEGGSADPQDNPGATARPPGVPAPPGHIGEHWKECLPRLAAELEAGAMRSWVEPLIAEYDDGRRLLLSAPSRLVRDFFAKTYGAAVERITEREVYVVTLDRKHRFGSSGARLQWAEEVIDRLSDQTPQTEGRPGQ